MIMDTLLAGKEVSAKEFANRNHVSDTMVTGVLKALGGALTRREQCIKKGRRGCKQVWYGLKDRAAVQAAREKAASRKAPNQYTNKGSALIDLDFGPLVQCWGINPVRSAVDELPVFVHRIHTRADHMEEDESCAAIAEPLTTV